MQHYVRNRVYGRIGKTFSMQSKKELSRLKNQNILEYIVKHGVWRLKRGRRLSATLPMPYNILNPEKAFKAAKEMLDHTKSNRARMRIRRQMLLTGQTPLEAMLGVRPPNEPPWPGARRVPHTTNWY